MSDLPPEELVKALRQMAPRPDDGGEARYSRQLYTQAAALIERLEARVAELEGETTAFLAKWDECKPHIDDAFLHRQLRCGQYTGPDLAEELYALRKASKSLTQGEG